jgi:hypothetical protein
VSLFVVFFCCLVCILQVGSSQYGSRRMLSPNFASINAIFAKNAFLLCGFFGAGMCTTTEAVQKIRKNSHQRTMAAKRATVSATTTTRATVVAIR